MLPYVVATAMEGRARAGERREQGRMEGKSYES
jgi:hypothetical protein